MTTATGRAAELPFTAAHTNELFLSVERIFGTKEFDDEKLGPFRWSRLSSAYFTWEASPATEKGRDLVRNDPATGAKEIVVAAGALIPPGETEPLAVDGFEFSPNESKLLIFTNSKRVWRRNTRGDCWVLDRGSRVLRKLGGAAAASTLMFAKFSPDGTRVAYVREHDLYVQELRRMRISALTTSGSPTVINGTADWVNEEELDLRDGYRWSPDGKSIAFWQFDTAGVREFQLIDNTAGSYPRITSFPYPKVGERNSAARLGVVSATGGTVRWLKVPGDPRENYLPHLEWTPDGARLWLQQFNRLQNTNHVMLADPRTGATRLIHTETDPAWLENENPARWVHQGRQFLWLSERDGWRHAYLVNADGKGVSRVTGGDFDVIQVEALDDAGGWLYFAASPENATQRYLYRTRLTGGAPERLSPAGQTGWHTYDISPDAEWAVHTYSTFTTPPVVELIKLPEHQVVRVLIENQKLRDKLARLQKPSAEFLQVDIGENRVFDVWCLRSASLAPGTKHPLLFHVYGEPHGQTVRDAWQGPRGLWHWLLAQQGYRVASVDNRGTMAPRGRAWRKSVHRQIGILASQEQAAAARALIRRWSYADAERVGIWGWSGGGSMSLNAIFRYPDLYQAAIAVAPNADQLLYDSIYQERYMGLPKDNADGYRNGSPLTHAHQLKGDLLLVHGTGDDNGHYQGTEKLMNELIANGKHFTVMPYPARSHGLSEGSNTTPHFYALLTRFLHDHLPVGPAAAPPSRPDRARQTGETHELRHVAGWTVHVSGKLLATEPAATARALELLQTQLEEIIRVVPAPAVRELQRVPLWFSPVYPGVSAGAEYHPGADWLRANRRDPAMAKGVEFSDIKGFESETRRMPNFTLHELAHAYHDRVLKDGFDHAEIRAAFDRAKAGGKYDRVQRQDAKGNLTWDRAYALTSPMEYFAETTEAFFSRNDFFPFTRDELRQHDPEMAILLERLWSSSAASAKTGPVGPPPPELKAPAFYKKYIDADGYPIVASEKVNDYALKEAAYLVNLMLVRRPDVRAAMVRTGSRMSIIAHNEFTTDQPEWAWMKPKDFWDARARGMGGSPTDPFCSTGEENLLAYPGDPYAAESILIHEFAHNIHLRGMVNVDPTFDPRVKAAYDSAMKAGLWKGKYASVNHHEYFAEGVQSWFDNNRVNDHDHNHVNTRALLLEYDPGLAALCREVFGDTVLKYTKPATRLRDHLAGYDPATAPTFVWPERLTKVKAEIRQKAQARGDAAEEGPNAAPKERAN